MHKLRRKSEAMAEKRFHLDDVETEGSDDECEFESDGYFYDDTPTPVGASVQSFTVLDPKRMAAEREAVIDYVSELLNVSRSVACILARSFGWNKEVLVEKILEDREKVLRDAGVSDTVSLHQGESSMACPICMEEYPGEEMYSLSCHHFYCVACWRGWVSTKLDEGPGCIFATCPSLKCNVVLDEDVFLKFLDDKGTDMFKAYNWRSYVSSNPLVMWCPQPGCGNAIMAKHAQRLSVQCKCGREFCFVCKNDVHEPAPCEMMREWVSKEQSDASTSNWLVSYTKDCPKCHSRTNKDGGCNHMSCKICRHDWCWVCLGSWTDHGENTGGFFSCNVYNDKKGSDVKISKARAELQKYTHYHDRYSNHGNSGGLERKLKSIVEGKKKEMMKMEQLTRWEEVRYMTDAVETLLRCRDRLKNSYVMAYYLVASNRKDLFEYRQQQLEGAVESLSELLENKESNILERSVTVNKTHLCRSLLNGMLDEAKEIIQDRNLWIRPSEISNA